MRLSRRTLSDLADMICGNADAGGFTHAEFPYRSSMRLTEFFANCDMDYVHDGSTRKRWVAGVLEELNASPATHPQLPADGILRVIEELMDPSEFEKAQLNRSVALEKLNAALSRDGLQAYLDATGRCLVRNLGTQVTSARTPFQKRSWSSREQQRRAALERYLDEASEDEFIDKVLAPMFSQLGFIRISVSGHKDRSLEYGKDLWMKYQLPTAHYLYFGVQAKRGKLDAAGKSKSENIAEVLAQIRMMLDHPVWDPETNAKNLLDHVFIACGGDITKQAREWLAQHLDQESRRRILFLDREHILDIATGVSLPISMGDDEVAAGDDELS